MEPGVAIGLAWTPNGGDILFIEATRMAGKKGLTLTGHLGDVMKESAQAALSYVRSRADRLGLPADFFENCDLHIHVPAGATPKDGPSAGITMATALASLLTGRPLHSHLAMTGEITLRGRVMPIGGLKEKVLAARRAGVTTVILPKRNEKDLEDVPASIREELKFHFVETIDEVLDIALEPAVVPVALALEFLVIDRRLPRRDRVIQSEKLDHSFLGQGGSQERKKPCPFFCPPCAFSRQRHMKVRCHGSHSH